MTAQDRCPHGISLTANPPCHFCEHTRQRGIAEAFAAYIVGEHPSIARDDDHNVSDFMIEFGDRPAVETSRKPDGYAYRYPHGNGESTIRFSNGGPVNGSSPSEAIPYFFGSPAETECSISDAEAQSLTIAGLREGIELIQDERLTWAMACPCSCQACDHFFEVVRDVGDASAEKAGCSGEAP